MAEAGRDDDARDGAAAGFMKAEKPAAAGGASVVATPTSSIVSSVIGPTT